MGDRLATIDMGRIFGGSASFFAEGELGTHLTQYRLGRGLPLYQLASGYIQPFGHNTPTSQTDRQIDRQDRADRQRSDSTWRTVIQRVAQKTSIRSTLMCRNKDLVLLNRRVKGGCYRHWTHWIQALLAYVQSSLTSPLNLRISSPFNPIALAAFVVQPLSFLLGHLHEHRLV